MREKGKKNKHKQQAILCTGFFFLLVLVSCGGKKTDQNTQNTDGEETVIRYIRNEEPDWQSQAVEESPDNLPPGLPENLVWYTSHPVRIASPEATVGGTFNSYLTDFPLTFRPVGPDGNGSFRSFILQDLGLVGIHPYTKDYIPGAATHWAFGEDKKSVYFALNQQARWTDEEPVDADDFVFKVMTFMRSENINDPWYNNYFTEILKEVRKYDQYTISVHLNEESNKEEILLKTAISPEPEHFYGVEGVPADYVESYNWKIRPHTGIYALKEYEKGKYILFSRVEDWWGYTYPVYQKRFNLDNIRIKVITGGVDIAYTHFLKGELDAFPLQIPDYWHDKTKEIPFEKGYIEKAYMNTVPLEGLGGLILNISDPLLANKDLRKGLRYAIDIQGMIDKALRGEYSRYHNIGLGHVVAGRNYDDNSIRYPDFDVNKAIEYFEKAGFTEFENSGIRRQPNGRRLKVEVLYSAPHHSARLSILKQEAKKTGLDLILKNVQGSEGFKLVREKKFQSWWGGMSTGVIPAYWEYFHSKNAHVPQNNNFFNYADPEMDDLVEAYRSAFLAEEKQVLSQEIQRKIFDEALIIPHYYLPYARGGHWRWVRLPDFLGTKYTASLYDLLGDGLLWIEEERKEETLAARKADQTFPRMITLNEEFR